MRKEFTPQRREAKKNAPEKESARFLILFKLGLYAGLLCNNGRRLSKCRRTDGNRFSANGLTTLILKITSAVFYIYKNDSCEIKFLFKNARVIFHQRRVFKKKKRKFQFFPEPPQFSFLLSFSMKPSALLKKYSENISSGFIRGIKFAVSSIVICYFYTSKNSTLRQK